MAKEINPYPDLIEKMRSNFRHYPVFDNGFVAGFMRGWMERTVKVHAAECESGSCKTCLNLSEALSMFAAHDIEYPPSPELLERWARIRRERE